MGHAGHGPFPPRSRLLLLRAIGSVLALACPRLAGARQELRSCGGEVSLLQSGLAVSSRAAVIQRSRAAVRRDLEQTRGDDRLLYSFPHCHMGSNDSGGSRCDLDSLTEDTLIFPGGRAHCLNGKYAFLVSPGDRDKLLLFFQGGGCCWDAMSYKGRLCTASIADSLSESDTLLKSGIFNRSDSRNPFRSYTLIRALYCTGDDHMGDSPVLWNPISLKTSPRYHGRANIMSILSWVRTNMAGTLESFVAAGVSAGSLAVQGWSWYLLNSLRWRRATLFPDSYGGLSPYRSGVRFGNEGCPAEILSPAGAAKCAAGGQMSWTDAMKNALQDFPDVRVGYIISKGDKIQRSFYMWQGYSLRKLPSEVNLTESDLNFRLTKLLWELIPLPNFIIYFLNGELHQFLDRPRLYNESSCRSDAATLAAGQPSLVDWVRAVVEDTSALPKDACCGPRMLDSPSNPADYCSATLFSEGGGGGGG